MPFQVRASDYFEKIELLKKMEELHPQNRLALCPVCAAKYQHANDTHMERLEEEILTQPIDAITRELEFEVQLAGRPESILLTARHVVDLQGAFGMDLTVTAEITRTTRLNSRPRWPK
ncbi:MAG: hypothetical protein IPL43_04410 [Micropruina sp.]|nr:hypothetical protein [Micropruina sp.]